MEQRSLDGPSMPAMDDAAPYAAARRSTLASVAVNAVLALLQILVGYFGRSQALLTDGIHTLSDLLSDFLVLFASRMILNHGAGVIKWKMASFAVQTLQMPVTRYKQWVV